MNKVGWIKIWRKMWDNPVFSTSQRVAVWVWILSNAVYEPTEVRFHGKKIMLQPGQLTFGSHQLGRILRVPAVSIRRTIAVLASEQLIEQRTDHQCSLITVKNWAEYQANEQRNEQPSSKQRAAFEQPSSTNKEKKKERIKETKKYVVTHETQSLYDFIEESCQKYGLKNEVRIEALDIQVERHASTIRLRPEIQKCLVWLLDKGLKSVTTRRVANWFEKAREFQRREQLRHLETAPWNKKKKVEDQGFSDNSSVDDFVASQA